MNINDQLRSVLESRRDRNQYIDRHGIVNHYNDQISQEEYETINHLKRSPSLHEAPYSDQYTPTQVP